MLKHSLQNFQVKYIEQNAFRISSEEFFQVPLLTNRKQKRWLLGVRIVFKNRNKLAWFGFQLVSIGDLTDLFKRNLVADSCQTEFVRDRLSL